MVRVGCGCPRDHAHRDRLSPPAPVSPQPRLPAALLRWRALAKYKMRRNSLLRVGSSGPSPVSPDLVRGPGAHSETWAAVMLHGVSSRLGYRRQPATAGHDAVD